MPSLSRQTVGTLLIITSALAFGTLALFARFADDAGTGKETLLFLRFGIASVFLLGMAAIQRPAMPPRSRLLPLLAMGLLYVGQSFTFFSALKYAPASLVSLMLYLYPAIVTVFAVVVYREKLTGVKLFALITAIAGSALTIGPITSTSPLGIAFGVGTACFYSAYLLVGTKALVGVNPLASSTVVIGTAAIVYFGLCVGGGFDYPDQPIGWLWAVLLALIPTVVAISTLLAGLERVGPITTSTLSAVEPVATVTGAMIFLGERITALQLLGGIMILGAVIVLSRAAASAELEPETAQR